MDAALNQPIEQGTVRVLAMPDSTFVTGTVTTLDGTFTINLDKAPYLLSISYIGYETLWQEVELSEAVPSVDLGVILMDEAGIMLSESVVVGKLPGMIIKQDTVEFQPDAYKTTPNAVVDDLLKKLPGVEIDSDGRILVNGQEVTKIMIDGEEFFGNDPSKVSANLPVEVIERLQVLEKKSDLEEQTGIDDGERQYVINLSIKPEKKKGMFGLVMGGVGNLERYEGRVMLNKFGDRKQLTLLASSNNTNNLSLADMPQESNKELSSLMGWGGQRGISTIHNAGLNINNKYGGNDKDNSLQVSANVMWSNFVRDEERTSNRENYMATTYNRVEQEQTNTLYGNQITANSRVVYYLTSKTNFYFTPTITYRTRSTYTDATYNTYDVDTLQMYHGVLDNQYEESYYTLSGTLTGAHSFEKRGRRLSASVSGSLSSSDGDTHNQTDLIKYDTSTGLEKNTTLSDDIDNKVSRSNNYKLRLLYTEPITTKLRLQFTYQFTRAYSDADKVSTEYDEDLGEQVQDDVNTNRFESIYYTHRFETGIRHYFDNLNYSLGLYFEPASLVGTSYLVDSLPSTFTKELFNISPYGTLTWAMSEENSLKITYRSFTRQPGVWQLQPGATTSNPTYVRMGNPDLSPQLYNTLKIKYNNYNRETQQSVVVTGTANIISDYITYTTEYDDSTGVSTSTPINVDGVWNAEGTLLFNTPLGNSPFRLATFSKGKFSRSIGYVKVTNDDGSYSNIRSTSDNYIAQQRLKLSYISDFIEVGGTTELIYNYATHSLLDNLNIDAWTSLNRAEVVVRFPYDITWNNSYEYLIRNGYGGDMDEPQHILNSDVSMPVTRNKKGVLNIKLCDILGQRSIINRTVSSTYIEDYAYNTLSQYGMVSFSYNISP